MKAKQNLHKPLWWHCRLVLVVAVILAASFVTVSTASRLYAESYEFEGTSVRLISHDSTAPADGKTAIKFTVEFYGYKCTNPDWRGIYIIYTAPEYCNDDIGTDYGPATGTIARTSAESPYSGNATVTGTINSNGFSGNLTGGSSLGHPHHQVIYPGADGRITLNFTSTVAESKHIHVDNGNISDPNSIEFDVAFTAMPGAKNPTADPNAPPPSSALGSTPKFIPVTEEDKKQAPVTEDTESLLKTSTIRLNNVELPAAGSDKQEIPEGQAIELRGTATANATVTLYIFSEPQIAEVAADENGNWSHTIQNLPVGDHHVETEVFDPATKTKTKRVNLTSFKVIGSSQPDGSSTGAANSSVVSVSKVPWIAVIITTDLLAIAICIFLARHQTFRHIFSKKAALGKKSTNPRKRRS